MLPTHTTFLCYNSNAIRYVMVPEDEFNRLKAKDSTMRPSTQVQSGEGKRLPTEISKSNTEVEQSDSQKLLALVNVVPKKWRSRASRLIQYMVDKLNSEDHEFLIDASNQIIYSNGDKGSPILDLVFYAIADQSYNYPRPLDYPEFLSLLKDLKVDESVLGAGKSFNDYAKLSNRPIDWKT